MRRFGKLAVAAGAAAVAVGVTPGLAAAGTAPAGAPRIALVSPIASGYAAVPKSGGAKAFIHVQSDWVVPAVTCTAKNRTALDRVGLDGITDATTEQDGVTEACVNAVPFYGTFYQMYPAAAVAMFAVAPGDQMQASVTADGSVYTLSVHDLTSGKSFTVTATCASCKDSSAEVTAGSPPGIGPAHFTVVHFTGISVTDSTGTTGGLANAAWTTLKLTQSGSPHTVAQPLHTASPPPHSFFADTWAP